MLYWLLLSLALFNNEMLWVIGWRLSPQHHSNQRISQFFSFRLLWLGCFIEEKTSSAIQQKIKLISFINKES
eukprot:UN10646